VAEHGDPWAGIDDEPGTLDALLELADRHKDAGLADAPWPPHFEKTSDEPTRAQPSRRRAPAKGAQSDAAGTAGTVPVPAPGKTSGPTGRRRSTMPLIEVARAAGKDEAMAGLERWKAKHPDVWPHLAPADILVDSMRGRSSTWTRIRLNLRNVPEDQRPAQEALEVDFDPWEGLRPPGPQTTSD
jgi:hypothetical protein